MASLQKVQLIIDSALRIDVDQSSFHGIDHTDLSLPWRYEISPGQIKDTRINKEKFKGWLSPTDRLTLAPHTKKLAGIPVAACTFAYMHPPQGLAEILTNDPAIEQKCRQTLDCNPINVIGVLSAVIMGGFAYFDKDFKCIRINAISDSKSADTLPFSGPYEVNKWVCEELYQAKRVQPLNLKNFREGGFVSIAWVRPYENFRFKRVFVAEKYNNDHGAMLYFREDGTAVGFRVDPFMFDDPDSDVGVISEIFGNITCDAGNIYDANIDKKTIQPVYEIKTWANKMELFRNNLACNDMNLDQLYESVKDKKTLIHHACHAALGIDFVTCLLSISSEKENLSYQDEFGWYPLHYACRFSPSDHKLIKLLLKQYPRAAMKADPCGRFPLHIACDSDTSVDVITALLDADTSKHKKTLLTGTKRLGFLPLHFACYKGASGSILKMLLDADIDGSSATKQTSRKQWPLHLAIIKKLPADTVKIFLDADSKLRRVGSFTSFGEADADVHQRNGDEEEGKLPLHLACWNNSSIDIIEMLLTKDKHNSTISEGIPESLEDPAFHKDIRSPGSMSFIISIEDSGIGGVALHLAMKHGSKNVIDLLLQKEMEREDYFHSTVDAFVAERKFKLSTLCRKDRRGRTPLHVACEHNIDPEVIRLLLKLDPYSITTQMCDDQGFTPMHYACDNENTSAETIKILCDAEELYIKSESREKHRSTHHRDSKRNRTPLLLAVKSNAPIETLEILLQPENFVLYGFDDSAFKSLASLVNQNDSLREKVVDKLSVRLYFFLTLAQLYSHVGSLVCLIAGSMLLKNADKIPLILPAINFCTVFVLTAVEFLEMMSVGADYTLSVTTWFYFLSACLSIYSAILMLTHRGGGKQMLTFDDEIVLQLTVFTLVLNIIFYFRATFLQFARFVGGVKTILVKLGPFMIVSSLLVVGFVYSFWIYETNARCTKGLTECGHWTVGRIFEYEMADKQIPLEFLFMIVILMILLNVVIAIVSDAWANSREGAYRYFWKFRLEKIHAMGYAEDKLNRLCSSKTISKRSGMCFNLGYFDSTWHTSYGKSDVTFWKKSPYSIVTKKEQYDNPCEYFSPELAEKINMVKSLHSDLYWAEKKKEGKLTEFEKFGVFLMWLSTLAVYAFLILLGFAFFGMTWPRKFRLALLNLNISGTKDDVEGLSDGKECEEEDSRKMKEVLHILEKVSDNRKMKEVLDVLEEDVSDKLASLSTKEYTTALSDSTFV